MADDPGSKEEEKFEFTPEGESLGYISLEQARVVAMQTARDEPGPLWKPLLWGPDGLRGGGAGRRG